MSYEAAWGCPAEQYEEGQQSGFGMAHAEQYGYGDVMQSSMGISYRAVWGYHAEQYGDMQSSMGRVNIEPYGEGQHRAV